MKTCLQDSVLNELNIPIIYDADISHKGPCLTIINGAIAMIKYNDDILNILKENGYSTYNLRKNKIHYNLRC